MLTTAVLVLNAASFPPFSASSARIGIKRASPRPSSRYVGRRDSIPFRVFVAPARRAEVKPPTMMPPKRRAKRTDAGLISEGCKRRKAKMNFVFVMRGIVKRLATASRRKALRMVEPFCLGSGMICGLLAGDFEDDIFDDRCRLGNGMSSLFSL